MPEYEMPIDSLRAQARFDKLDEFTQGYVEAVMWIDGADESFDKISVKDLREMVKDCKDFQHECAADLRLYAAQRSMHSAGVDFWLTRNHHGAGFWDRGMGDLGERLSKAARFYGSQGLDKGDDGRLYLY